MVCFWLWRLQWGYEANTGAVVPEMKLSPNVGSDRSWVWNAAADVSEGEPEAQTLAIRFANPESTLLFFVGEHQKLIRYRRQPLQGGIHQGSARQRGSLRQDYLRDPSSPLLFTSTT